MPATHVENHPSSETLFYPSRGPALSTLLAKIETENLAGLRHIWSQRFGTPPSLRSVELMRQILGWRLQASLYGGLDAGMRRQLRRRLRVEVATTSSLDIGTTLKRTWQGDEFIVEVVQDGFRLGECRFASLSAVAKAITGTCWNGPRFFGLREIKA